MIVLLFERNKLMINKQQHRSIMSRMCASGKNRHQHTINSFAFLFGPASHLKHTFSKDRLPFTSSYLGSLLATLFVSFHLQSTGLTIIFATIQVLSLVWYFVSYLPHGHTTMKFFATMMGRSVTSTLPI